MSDDNIFKEVDEELRHERYREIWNKYGIFVIAIAVLAVGSVGGLNLWKYWKNSQAAQAGNSYMSALELQRAGKNTEAQKQLRKIMAEGPNGYKILGKLKLAASLASEGKAKEAAELYRQLANDTAVDPVLKGFAAVQSAMLTIDKSSFSEIEKLMLPISGDGSAWRHSAWEMIALSAYKEDNFEVANKWYRKVANDKATPQDLRRRAQIVLDVIASKQAENRAKN